MCYPPAGRKRPVRREGKRAATVRVAQEVCLAVAIAQEAGPAAGRWLEALQERTRTIIREGCRWRGHRTPLAP